MNGARFVKTINEWVGAGVGSAIKPLSPDLYVHIAGKVSSLDTIQCPHQDW